MPAYVIHRSEYEKEIKNSANDRCKLPIIKEINPLKKNSNMGINMCFCLIFCFLKNLNTNHDKTSIPMPISKGFIAKPLPKSMRIVSPNGKRNNTKINNFFSKLIISYGTIPIIKAGIDGTKNLRYSPSKGVGPYVNIKTKDISIQ